MAIIFKILLVRLVLSIVHNAQAALHALSAILDLLGFHNNLNV